MADSSINTPAQRLTALQAWLKGHGAEGFVLSSADAFQSEYPPESAQRLGWLTGFTGSAGWVAVLQGRAAFFTDGRYTLQAEAEVPEAFERFDIGEVTPAAWLAEHANDARIGYDPWLLTAQQLAGFEARGLSMRPLAENPVDALWHNRPAAPASVAHAHPLQYAGKPAAEKIAAMTEALRARGLDGYYVTAPDGVCWLLNLRGGDVPCTPLLLARAYVDADGGAVLFADAGRLDDAARGSLKDLSFEPDMLAHAARQKGRRLGLDGSNAPLALMQALADGGAEIRLGEDPCQLPKACKNDAELAGIRAAHLRDGVALIRLLHWLDTAETLPDELEVVERLEGFRAAAPEYRGPSFPAIAGSGPHGAIVHYRADEKSNRRLQQGELFLLDSGGQYPDGTTDVTRTVAIGAPSEEMRRNFTLVLKGHIALASARFPKGTTGSQLDALARSPLWAEGLDYEHGTGHGVGQYLGVHEGPQRISKRPSDVALQPGMILSNEPGNYKTGAYGIRIENLVAVVADKKDGWLRFENLTCAPIDRRLVDSALLTEAERQWLDDYHAWVLEEQFGRLAGDVPAWLQRACAAV